jgi:phage protein D
MSGFLTPYDESTNPANRDFYAPGFELRINGVGLPRGVLRDVMEVTYHDDVNEIDGFELTVNNWDDSARRCKYIGSETAAQLASGSAASALFTLFDPGLNSCELALGYTGSLQSMVKASFQSVDPNFPESGPPVLTVRGLNILQQLRTKKYTYAWSSLTTPNNTPSNIALSFNSFRDGGQPRLRSSVTKQTWTVTTNAQASAAETAIDYVAQTDQYDVAFLMQLAHSQGYVLEAYEDDQTLYFGPSQQAQPTNYQLAWGKGLISFKPSLSTSNQWQSVTVRGWDRQTQKPISATVDLTDPQVAKLNKNLHNLIQDRQQQTVDLPVFTLAEAKQKARAMLLDRSKEIVTAHGKTVGLPNLRAGTLVNIQGVGARLSGTYFVTKTTHTLGEGGYVTEFDCRREDPGIGGTG